MLHSSIGVDLGGSTGTCPPNNRETPMHLSLFNTFPPIFWFAHSIFLPSLRMCIHPFGTPVMGYLHLSSLIIIVFFDFVRDLGGGHPIIHHRQFNVSNAI